MIQVFSTYVESLSLLIFQFSKHLFKCGSEQFG